MDDAEIPKALIKRIARAKLARLEQASGVTDGRETQVSKDALLALAESARVFINYLTATGASGTPPRLDLTNHRALLRSTQLRLLLLGRQRYLQGG